MNIIGTILIGLIVGLVARFVKPGEDKMGIVMTTLVGIAGAFVGKLVGQLLGIYSSYEPAGFVGAVLGAVVVLAALKSFTGHRKVTQ